MCDTKIQDIQIGENVFVCVWLHLLQLFPVASIFLLMTLVHSFWPFPPCLSEPPGMDRITYRLHTHLTPIGWEGKEWSESEGFKAIVHWWAIENRSIISEMTPYCIAATREAELGDLKRIYTCRCGNLSPSFISWSELDRRTLYKLLSCPQTPVLSLKVTVLTPKSLTGKVSTEIIY